MAARDVRIAFDARLAWLPLAALTTFAVWLIVSPMLSAQLGPVDDYEIVAILGPSRHLALPDLVSTMNVWISNDVQRVRPGRWVLRILEAFVWGDNAGGWYFDRLVLAGVAAIAAVALAVKYVPRPVAALVALLVIVGLQSEIWYRLGPQETYAVPLFLGGLALLAYGRAAGLVLVVAAALTKEAFVPMAALAVGWAWLLGFRREAVVAGAAVVAIGLTVAYVLATHGEPFGQVRTIPSIELELRWMLGASAAVTAWPILIVVLLLVDQRLAALAGLLAIAIFVPQAVLDVDMGAGRYMLPAALGAIAMTAAALGAIATRWRRVGLVATYAVAALVIPSLLTQAQAASASSADTRAFHAGIVALERALAERPEAVLVVRPADLWDIEPIGAIRTYVAGPRAVLMPPPARTTPPMSDAVAAAFADRSARGGYGYEPWFQPASCVEADLHFPAPTPVCDTVVVVTGWTIP